VHPSSDAAPSAPDDGTVVIHTSVRGLLAAFTTPILLIGLGWLGVSGIGTRPVPLAFLGTGLALGLVVLYDHPSRVQFDRDGVHRICPLRRQRLAWDRVSAIERPRPSSLSALRNLRERPDEPIVSGGLLARGHGRRRWLLSDRIESRDEYDRLRELVLSLPTTVRLRAARPHDGIPPTDLYRSSRRR
jgi:hypothetical protein